MREKRSFLAGFIRNFASGDARFQHSAHARGLRFTLLHVANHPSTVSTFKEKPRFSSIALWVRASPGATGLADQMPVSLFRSSASENQVPSAS